ncbi:MAG: response regulator [Ardenticatenales bacterium]|nr:response regulator [Ardenticatenales bacterium]
MSKHRPIILIVEDDPDSAFIATQLISRRVEASYVNSMVTGYSALSWIEENPQYTPDLILLDIQIPGEDGYTVLKRLRAHQGLADTHIVALTANILSQSVERTQQAGFDGFIGKPVDPVRFPEQVRRLLQGEAVWEPR